MAKAAKHHKQLYVQTYFWPLLASLLAITVFWWVMGLKIRYGVPGFEVRWFRAINNWSDHWRWFWLAVTQAGSLFAVGAALVVALIRRHKKWFNRLLTYSLTTYAVVFVLKALVNQPRPASLLADVHQRESFAFNSLGFPSSHTATATVLALLVWQLLPSRWRWLVPLWIVTVGVSRIYLGAHTPLDVIGGVCIGVLVVAFGNIIAKDLHKA